MDHNEHDQYSHDLELETEKHTTVGSDQNCEHITPASSKHTIIKPLVSLPKKAIIAALALIVSLLCATLVFIIPTYQNAEKIEKDSPAYRYRNAIIFIVKGDYEEAYSLLCSCYGYKNSAKLLKCFRIEYGIVEYKYSNKNETKKEIYLYSKNTQESISAVYTSDGVIYSFDKVEINGNKKISYDYGMASDRPHSFYKTITEYDDNGNEISLTFYTSNDRLIETLTKKYDENGNLILSTTYAPDGKEKSKTVYVYTDNGDLLSFTSYDSDGKERSKAVYELDDNGNYSYYCFYKYEKKAEETIYTPGVGRTSYSYYDSGATRSERIYDINGNLIREAAYERDGSLGHIYEYGYDENGNVIREIHYDENGKATPRYEYNYDSNGKKTHEIHYNKNGEVQYMYEYEYNKHGNMILFKHLSSEMLLLNKKTYNENGKPKEATYYDDEGNQTRNIIYIYDKNGFTKYVLDYNADRTFNSLISLSVPYVFFSPKK